MTKIMLMARDPGGANTIIPVAGELQKKGYKPCLYGKDAALIRYRQFGLHGIDINTVLPTIDVNSWIDYLVNEKPAFIITGTSGDDFSERFLWKAASSCGIKTFAILDQWMNYGIRFSAYTPGQIDLYEQEKEYPYLPDYILVMDEEAQQQLAAEGIPPNQILISGQPYFDLILAEKENINHEKLKAFRQNIGIEPNTFLITFVSEPLSQDYSREEKKEDYFGYDEKSICNCILEGIDKISSRLNQDVCFIIKQHPREPRKNYQDIIERYHDTSIKIKVEKEIPSWLLILSSDLVCGMSSMLLLEAVLLDCPVISVQIGLNRDNPLVLDKKGILKSIVQQDELDRCLRNIILRKDMPVINWPIKSGAASRVIQYMEDLL